MTARPYARPAEQERSWSIAISLRSGAISSPALRARNPRRARRAVRQVEQIGDLTLVENEAEGALAESGPLKRRVELGLAVSVPCPAPGRMRASAPAIAALNMSHRVLPRPTRAAALRSARVAGELPGAAKQLRGPGHAGSRRTQRLSPSRGRCVSRSGRRSDGRRHAFGARFSTSTPPDQQRTRGTAFGGSLSFLGLKRRSVTSSFQWPGNRPTRPAVRWRR